MLGGPIIRVRAGDTLRVTLKNDLRAEPFATASLNNKIRSFSTTNLHLHGLHISPEDPGDSMFVAVVPDGSYEYVYEIPADHMAGTAWCAVPISQPPSAVRVGESGTMQLSDHREHDWRVQWPRKS
eukprot:4278808-Pleurochrysis_carterae.AAC.1